MADNPLPGPAPRPRLYSAEANLGKMVVRKGGRAHPATDLYYQLLLAPWWVLIGMFAAGYLLTNLVFGYLYWSLGATCVAEVTPGSYADAFFFSVQTVSTVGYGVMHPACRSADYLVMLEVFLGILGFAMATGLTFAKFSRPTARVLFSRVAVVGPHQGKPSLQFRMANARGNQIVETTIRGVLLRDEVTAEGVTIRKLLDLKFVRDTSPMFALTWTVFHIIDESSPLYGYTREQLAASDADLLLILTGLDDTLLATVHARAAYRLSDDVIWDARFVDIIRKLPDGRREIDFTRFHDTLPLS